MQAQDSHLASKAMTGHLKLQILAHMRLVPPNTAWGYAARDFVENREAKTDLDYEVLLHELGADIQDGPGTMRQVLGPTYQFFHQLVV